jgi:hypothetical protein
MELLLYDISLFLKQFILMLSLIELAGFLKYFMCDNNGRMVVEVDSNEVVRELGFEPVRLEREKEVEDDKSPLSCILSSITKQF